MSFIEEEVIADGPHYGGHTQAKPYTVNEHNPTQKFPESEESEVQCNCKSYRRNCNTKCTW